MSEDVVEEFENVTADELDMLLAEDDIELDDSDTNDVGLISGTVIRKVDRSKVCIESIPRRISLLNHRHGTSKTRTSCILLRKTISELREMGFDEDKIDKIGPREHRTRH